MRHRGFTLLEVLITIAILGLIVAFTFSNYGKVTASRSLQESSDRLRTLIMRAHAEAMRSGLKLRISFPGTPDPNDPLTKDEQIDVPAETFQPSVQIQADHDKDGLPDADSFDDCHDDWTAGPILQPGTRCVAVLPGQPNFDINTASPIAGPSMAQGVRATFVPLTLNPEGTCDWVTFVLTDLPPDVQLEAYHAPRILNVIVDGRTGQTWIQRALRVDEVEVMHQHGASPILHVDFTSPDEITERNILQIHVGPGGASGGGVPR